MFVFFTFRVKLQSFSAISCRRLNCFSSFQKLKCLPMFEDYLLNPVLITNIFHLVVMLQTLFFCISVVVKLQSFSTISCRRPELLLKFWFCPRVPVHKNRYKRSNNVQQLNKGS